MDENNLLILLPDPNKWYETLDEAKKLQNMGLSVLILDRFLPLGGTITISEEKMNELGWYKK